jgi:lipid-A-disaccharide synthase
MESLPRSIPRILLSAGEASGDLHGAYLVGALKSINSAAQITCLGGPRLQEAGAELLVNNRDLAVVGLFEVFRHSRSIYRAWQKIQSYLRAQPPHITILIDFPDFNLLVARAARQAGSRIFYYISPQVWAWRAGRLRSLKRLVDQMAVILPFEREFYRRYDMEVEYVGHPLLDVIAKELPYAEPNPSDGFNSKRGTALGLLPGSRQSEMRALLPLLLDAAALIGRKMPAVTFLLPVAAGLDRHAIESEISRRKMSVQVVSGDTYGVIRSCDLILTASGTVTLEAAILGTPMIIIYKVSGLTYYAGRHLIRVNFVGLPNLIAGRRVVPELLQQDAKAERIATEAMALLANPEKLNQQRKDLAAVVDQLGESGVAQRVAALVLKQLG